MPTCGNTGCDRLTLARGMCRKHYYQDYYRRRGETSWEAAVRRNPSLRAGPAVKDRPPVPPCAVIGCDERSKVRGWCGKHYQRWRRFGDPEFHPPQVARRCTIDACPSTANARGMCSMHYRRWQVHGDPRITSWSDQTAGPGDVACSVAACTRRVTARGWCALHYGRWRRHRDPLVRDAAQTRRECAACGRLFDVGTGRARKYCGRACKPSRRAGSVNRRSWVEILGNGDGWTCWLCEEPVNRALYWPAPLCGSVDHYLPVSRGGTDERHNLRLAHLTCNTARKDKLIT